MAYEVEMMKIEELKPYENNPRINEKAVERVVSSIKEVGWRVPIIADEDKVILAGHTRLKAAKVLQIKEVPVHISKGLTDEQKSVYRIMDNKSSEFAEWDNELLAEEFTKLAESNIDLDLTGFDFQEIEKLTENLINFTEPEEIITDVDIADFGDIQTSNVRMVNIFLTQETEPLFQEMVANLKDKWDKENLTDTVFSAVERCYKDESP